MINPLPISINLNILSIALILKYTQFAIVINWNFN